ncbi:PAS domain S-box protein [Chlorogloeopsis sp. ULAP01]|uniref:PAS domain S-box protein n=1 Tax=Chlorogloeopsis sp. ULAP01 TaxID=3056483 RepID=UPI0025AA898C|nr:PAS domain S-box protein [Chlorogloeopsis sp. ULAP01]MDM9385096.1 PAS domain S-box protein [Chlorogloeopsis sp. ULAP01]
MSNATRTYLLHYGTAVLSVALALVLTLRLQPFLAPANLSLFYLAVVISTRYGGIKAGIAATILSTLAVNYFLITPLYSFSISSSSLVPLGVFLLVTLLISSLDSQLQTAQQRALNNLQALQESEERYRVLAENVPQLVWNARSDGYIDYFNQQWYAYTGLTPNSSLGWEWQRAIHPDDLVSAQRAWKTGLATKSRIEGQYRLQSLDGKYRWHITRAVPQRNCQGEVTNWFGSFTDIHNHKQIEQERICLLEEVESKQRLVEAVLQQMPAGLLVAEAPSGRLLLKNEQVQQILGYDLPLVEGFEEYNHFQHYLLHPDGRAYKNEEKPLMRSLSTGEVVTNEEIELVCADCSRKTILADSCPIRNQQGEIVAALLTFYDITKRKQVQREIQQTNQTLKTLVAASPLPIVLIQPDCTVRLWNPAAERLFGWTEAEVLNQILPIVPEDKKEECRLVRELLLNGETFFGVETYRCKRDGSQIILSISAAPICDEDGIVNTMMLIFQDITERQLAETALRESEERFRQLAETIQDVFWVSNPFAGEIFYVSPAYEQVWGRTCESLYTNPAMWMQTVHPEDRERLQATFFSQITEGKYDAEYRITRSDGSMRWIRDRGFPIKNESGEIYRVVGVAEDITDGKLAQIALRDALQRLNFHVENTPLAVIEWNTNLQITRWSAAATRIFGWQAQEVLYRKYGEWQFVYEEDSQRVLNVWRQILSGNEPQILCCNRNYTKSGNIVHCEWYNSTLTDELGNVVSVLSLVQDVTKRQQAEQERENLLRLEQAARESAETANRIKDEFLAVLSHELRSPLNPILGWTKLLRSRKFDPDATDRALETIERNAKLQTQLIEDLLDVSRILRGKLSLNVVPINLAATIEAALETVRLSAEAKDIQIQKLFAPDVGLVAGDPNRLQQIVWNLLSNAIKFTPNGGQVEVRLGTGEWGLGTKKKTRGGHFRAGVSPEPQHQSLPSEVASRQQVGKPAHGAGSSVGAPKPPVGEGVRRQGDNKTWEEDVNNDSAPITQNPITNPPSGSPVATTEGTSATRWTRQSLIANYAQIQVKDTGKGINPEFLPYVFDYFRQADSGTTRNFGGLGLGLAIVRHIVESHGGTVWAESPGEGQGATFTVCLPLLKESRGQGDKQTNRQEENLSPHPLIPSSHPLPLSGVRILAVDDEADMRDYVSFVLEQSGAEVTVAASAEEALTSLVQIQPDVLVTDIGMPNTDGYMLLQQIRALNQEAGKQFLAVSEAMPKAIALTAYAGEYDQKRAIAAGFQIHLPKPVEPDALVEAIASLIERT